jgi:hypothetical protein
MNEKYSMFSRKLNVVGMSSREAIATVWLVSSKIKVHNIARHGSAFLQFQLLGKQRVGILQSKGDLQQKSVRPYLKNKLDWVLVAHTCVILPSWEAGIRKIMIPDQPGQKSSRNAFPFPPHTSANSWVQWCAPVIPASHIGSWNGKD